MESQWGREIQESPSMPERIAEKKALLALAVKCWVAAWETELKKQSRQSWNKLLLSCFLECILITLA